jgi:hypothetical protein
MTVEELLELATFPEEFRIDSLGSERRGEGEVAACNTLRETQEVR